MWKCRLAVVLLLSLLPFVASAESDRVAIFDYDDSSCGAWVQSAGSEMGRAQYHSWFRGFVSGYNFGRSDNQVPLQAMPNEQTLYLFIDKYCRENPLKPFVSAAFKLVEELRENKGTGKAKGRQ